MSSPSAGKRRMDTDVLKLIESKHEVTILGGLNEFSVKFYGPKGTPYEGGVWRVRVDLPDKYPFKSPSIGFMNKIYHPNIDEVSGTVCLDVINQTWSALYDLSNIFESFLPQLLTYPNPIDPLNGDAAAMYLHKPEEYKKKVTEYVRRFASEEAMGHLDRSASGSDATTSRYHHHHNHPSSSSSGPNASVFASPSSSSCPASTSTSTHHTHPSSATSSNTGNGHRKRHKRNGNSNGNGASSGLPMTGNGSSSKNGASKMDEDDEDEESSDEYSDESSMSEGCPSDDEEEGTATSANGRGPSKMNTSSSVVDEAVGNFDPAAKMEL